MPMANARLDQLPPINFTALAEALLGRIEALVPLWVPGGHMQGREYVAHSLWRAEKTPSLKVCMTGSNAGVWMDFGGEHRGNDLVSLYAKIHGLSNGKAAVQLARELGLESVAGVLPARDGAAKPLAPPAPPQPEAATRPKRDKETWTPVAPAPAQAPKPTFWHYQRNPDTSQPCPDMEHVAEYRVGDDLYGFVVRFRTSTGGKDTLPYVWATSDRDGTSTWKWRGWDEPRPLYFPGHALPAGRTVVLVEGEKKADALHAVLESGAPGVYCVVSWAGGCKAWRKARWEWLAGAAVLLWPDCDGKRELVPSTTLDAMLGDAARAAAQNAQPFLPAHKQGGMAAMLGIGVVLRDAHACSVQLLAIPEPGAVADGWDCADAINTDGWDFARVAAFFATAYALPLADAEKPASATPEQPGEPLRDGPVTTGGAEDGSFTVSGREIPAWLRPYYDADKCRWLTSRKMVIAALEHDPALSSVLGLNQLSNNLEARVAWPWAHGKAGPITGSTDLLLGDYLTRTYGLPSIARAALTEAIETVAHARPFHPIRDWLTTLQWDNTPRLDKWLIYVLGLDPETLAPALAEYLKRVGRYWLLGMVNRVMEPGCKFDYCPVLEGPGGLGKSTLAEALAGVEYFSDTHFDIGKGREGQEQVQGLWVYEIAELANFGKAEIGLIKAFITAKVDRYRPAYGRVVEAYARQCVLVGTTNESTYLRDRTGNRRFWPIPVTNRIKNPWVRKWREQLFAEAHALYMQGEPFTPTPEEEARLFVPMQESRLIETAVVSDLFHLLTREPVSGESGQLVNNLTGFVTIAQLVKAMGIDAAKSSPALEAQVRGFLDHEGWERTKKMVNKVRAWGYERPKNWPPKDDEKPQGLQTPVAPSATGPSTEEEDADDAPF
jgi:putative DNA primase/helicase